MFTKNVLILQFSDPLWRFWLLSRYHDRPPMIREYHSLVFVRVNTFWRPLSFWYCDVNRGTHFATRLYIPSFSTNMSWRELTEMLQCSVNSLTSIRPRDFIYFCCGNTVNWRLRLWNLFKVRTNVHRSPYAFLYTHILLYVFIYGYIHIIIRVSAKYLPSSTHISVLTRCYLFIRIVFHKSISVQLSLRSRDYVSS